MFKAIWQANGKVGEEHSKTALEAYQSALRAVKECSVPFIKVYWIDATHCKEVDMIELLATGRLAFVKKNFDIGKVV